MAASFRPEKLCGVLGILCFLLLSYPLLQIFNPDTFVAGRSTLVFVHLWRVGFGDNRALCHEQPVCFPRSTGQAGTKRP